MSETVSDNPVWQGMLRIKKHLEDVVSTMRTAMLLDQLYPAVVVEALGGIEAERATLMKHEPAVADAEAALAELDIVALGLPECKVRVGYRSLELCGAIINVGDSYTDPVREVRSAIPLLRALRARGYRPYKPTGEYDWQKPVSDYAEINRRTYLYVKDQGQPGERRINICLFTAAEQGPSDQPLCRYVVVGHRQEPVYELRCGEAKPDEVEAAAAEDKS